MWPRSTPALPPCETAPNVKRQWPRFRHPNIHKSHGLAIRELAFHPRVCAVGHANSTIVNRARLRNRPLRFDRCCATRPLWEHLTASGRGRITRTFFWENLSRIPNRTPVTLFYLIDRNDRIVCWILVFIKKKKNQNNFVILSCKINVILYIICLLLNTKRILKK